MLSESALHLKVLAYDRSLRSRVKDAVRLGVLYSRTRTQKRDPSMLAAFRVLAKKVRINELPVVVVPIAFASVEQLANDLRAGRINVLYVGPEFAKETRSIASQVVAMKLPTICSLPSQAAEGLAVSIHLDAGKHKITVNLPAARAMGMNLSAQFLRLVDVLR